jgi:predicted transcriptional regulator
MNFIRSALDWLGWERLSETKDRHNELKKIMALNQTQLIEKLKELSTQQDKIAAEQSKRFEDLTEVVKKLTEQSEAGEVSPEVETTLGELATKMQAMDDTIPDAPEPE